MRFIHNLPYILLGGVMILHGFAHSPAILGSWDLATFEDVSRAPNFLLTNAGEPLLYLLGAIWLLAAISFIAAGVGALRQAFWWPMAFALAIVTSVPMTILWRDDAAIGLLLNAALLAIMVGWYLVVGMRREGSLA